MPEETEVAQGQPEATAPAPAPEGVDLGKWLKELPDDKKAFISKFADDYQKQNVSKLKSEYDTKLGGLEKELTSLKHRAELTKVDPDILEKASNADGFYQKMKVLATKLGVPQELVESADNLIALEATINTFNLFRDRIAQPKSDSPIDSWLQRTSADTRLASPNGGPMPQKPEAESFISAYADGLSTDHAEAARLAKAMGINL